MNKGGYVALQILGMIATIACAQAVIRSLINHTSIPLWGAFDWVPGGWGRRLLALILVTAAGVLLAGWAHDRQQTD